MGNSLNGRNIVVLIGPPASGKGTQAQTFEEKLGYRHLSTGDMFREIMKEDTELGMSVKYYMDRAMLVPDDLAVDVLESKISNMKDDKIMLDGYPRTIEQANKLDKKVEIDTIIHLDVSLDSIKERIRNRRICPKCKKIYNMLIENIDKCKICDEKLVKRIDDKESIVESRYKEFIKVTQPVINYYKSQNRLTKIDGEGPVEDVFNRVENILEDKKDD